MILVKKHPNNYSEYDKALIKIAESYTIYGQHCSLLHREELLILAEAVKRANWYDHENKLREEGKCPYKEAGLCKTTQ